LPIEVVQVQHIYIYMTGEHRFKKKEDVCRRTYE